LIGVDTNVLVRLFVVDNPAQSKAALQFFAERSATDPAFISLVVVAELVWLLDDTYDFSHAEIVETLKRILASPDFALEEPEFVADAVAFAEHKKIDISDFLIARIALEHGGRSIATFDINAAKRVPGMELLK
jgi:predicted nucleic-acid-binding protein